MAEENLNIKVFDKCVVGLQPSHKGVPSGLMTPYVDNAAGRKRAEQSIGYGDRRGGMGHVIFDNRPLSGFRVSRTQRSMGWREVNTFMRIEDPRGFELSITVTNMIMLTDGGVIHNGEIMQECIWARDGVFDVLLPVNSEPYRIAMENVRRTTAKISLRDVNIGDYVGTDKAEKGIYMGSFYALMVEEVDRYSQHATSHRKITRSAKKLHVLKKLVDDKVEYHAYATFKVADIFSPAVTPLTIQESEAQIWADKEATVVSWSSNERVVGFVADDVAFESRTLVPFDISELNKNRWRQPSVLYQNPTPVVGTHAPVVGGMLARYPKPDEILVLDNDEMSPRQVWGGRVSERQISVAGRTNSDHYFAFKIADRNGGDNLILHPNYTELIAIHPSDTGKFFHEAVTLSVAKTGLHVTILI